MTQEDLVLLLEITEAYEIAKAAVHEAQEEVNKVMSYIPGRLQRFDKEHKKTYVTSLVGMPPEEPNQRNPFNRTKRKKKAYEDDLRIYNIAKQKAEDKYFVVHEQERKLLRQEDVEEKEALMHEVNMKLIEARKVLYEAKDAWENDRILTDSLRSADTIRQLISLMEEGTVETVEDAILHYCERESINLEELNDD